MQESPPKEVRDEYMLNIQGPKKFPKSTTRSAKKKPERVDPNGVTQSTDFSLN